MKKSLLALAVLGAFATGAQAQSSNVTIGGFFYVGPKLYKVSSVNAAARPAGQQLKNEFRMDDDASSRLWVTGKEDLGGGSFAQFYMESRFGGDTGSNATTFGLANGDTFVGLGNTSLGTLDFGRMSISNYTQGVLVELDRTGSANNFGTTTFLSDVGGFGVNKTRLNNFIRYKSPNWAGFTMTAAVSPSIGVEGTAPVAGAANNDYSEGGAYQLGFGYANGPLYLNAAYFRVNQEGITNASTFALGDNTSYRLSGSYTLGFGLKLGFSVDRTEVSNLAAGAVMGNFTNNAFTAATGGGTVAATGKVRRTAWVLPITYTMGANNFYAKYGQAGNLSNWTTTDTGAKYYSLAWDYALSKRTAVGVSYTVIDNDANGTYQPFATNSTHNGSALFAGEKATNYQLNLKHSF
jgi:predicted porin